MNLTLRISPETKWMINNLMALKEKLFQKEKSQLPKIQETENPYIFAHLVYKVSYASVITGAVKETQHYSIEKWKEVLEQLNKTNFETKKMTDTDNNLTPRIIISNEIYDELISLRIKLQKPGQRPPLVSFAVKLVLFAVHIEKGLLPK